MLVVACFDPSLSPRRRGPEGGDDAAALGWALHARVGAGENLNEHVVGGYWPIALLRHEMLDEAVQIIRALWAGGYVTYHGKHFDVERAKVWDLPETMPPISIAVSGPASCRLAGRRAAVMIAVEPRSELGQLFDQQGGSGKPRVGQIAVACDRDEHTALERAMDEFRRFTGGWRVNAELPLPASFDAASRTVREDDIVKQMPCGPDLERHAAGIRQFEAAGFTHGALVQIGRRDARGVHLVGGHGAAPCAPHTKELAVGSGPATSR